MSTLSFEQDTPEEFTATVKYRSRTEQFKANKVRIAASKDEDNQDCWTLMAFHDTKDAVTGSAVANVIHIYIARGPEKGDHQLGAALSLPEVRVNSASYFKFADDVPDAKNQLDTVHDFLGTGGHINYEWDAHYTTVIGTFRFDAKDPDGEPFEVDGQFKLFNPQVKA